MTELQYHLHWARFHLGEVRDGVLELVAPLREAWTSGAGTYERTHPRRPRVHLWPRIYQYLTGLAATRLGVLQGHFDEEDQEAILTSLPQDFDTPLLLQRVYPEAQAVGQPGPVPLAKVTVPVRPQSVVIPDRGVTCV